MELVALFKEQRPLYIHVGCIVELTPIIYINSAIPTEVSDNDFNICIPEVQYQNMRSDFGVYIPANMPLIVLPSVGKYELR
jgi:hypothetical protein